MWVTKLLISPVKKRIFCPKTTKFGPKLAFLVKMGQAMQAYSVPCWWVGWWLWRAGCISQDTYLLYPDSREDNNHHRLYHHCYCPNSQSMQETITQFQNSHIRQCQPGPRPQGSWKFWGKSMNLDTLGIFGCKDLGFSNFSEQVFSKH